MIYQQLDHTPAGPQQEMCDRPAFGPMQYPHEQRDAGDHDGADDPCADEARVVAAGSLEDRLVALHGQLEGL